MFLKLLKLIIIASLWSKTINKTPEFNIDDTPLAFRVVTTRGTYDVDPRHVVNARMEYGVRTPQELTSALIRNEGLSVNGNDGLWEKETRAVRVMLGAFPAEPLTRVPEQRRFDRVADFSRSLYERVTERVSTC
jgi:hypothetical protein